MTKAVKTRAPSSTSAQPRVSLAKWRYVLTSKGLSQRLVGQRVRLSEAEISRMAHGARPWPDGKLEEVARVLGVTLQALTVKEPA